MKCIHTIRRSSVIVLAQCSTSSYKVTNDLPGLVFSYKALNNTLPSQDSNRRSRRSLCCRLSCLCFLPSLPVWSSSFGNMSSANLFSSAVIAATWAAVSCRLTCNQLWYMLSSDNADTVPSACAYQLCCCASFSLFHFWHIQCDVQSSVHTCSLAILQTPTTFCLGCCMLQSLQSARKHAWGTP